MDKLKKGADAARDCRHEANNYTMTPHALINRRERERRARHRALTLWFTGLSGSGKSTLAHGLEERLFHQGIRTYVFDGDKVRHGLCGDLGFSPEDRAENVRRIAETVRLFLDAGVVCLCAFISPLQVDRERVRKIINDCDFRLIHVRCALNECERRDEKGYYRLAREGKIKNYTGISAPYEEPTDADLVLDTDALDKKACLDLLEEYLHETGCLLAE